MPTATAKEWDSITNIWQAPKRGVDMSGGMEEMAALQRQEGGDHYVKQGDYQPWKVLKQWLTPEEFRGFMKGTAIVYLAREADKGGDQDVKKAAHTLEGLIALGLWK